MLRNQDKEGVLFDCDGILVDTEGPLYILLAAAFNECSVNHSHVSPQHIASLCSGTVDDGATQALEKLATSFDFAAGQASDLYHQTMDSLAQQKNLATIEGVKDIIIGLYDLGHVFACVSNARDDELKHNLGRAGLLDYFTSYHGDPLYYSATPAAGFVKRPKPYPDGYLKAANIQGLRPEQCVVIEDSPSGVRAGVAAGMDVIAFSGGEVRAPGIENDLRKAGASIVVPTMKEIHHILLENLSPMYGNV